MERGEVALFLRVVDIRTRIRRLVGLRKVGGTNEDRESSTKNLKARERRGNDQLIRGNEMENERRLWLWTNDHQPGLARGPDHRRDLVGRTGPLGAPGEKNSPEETMPTWLGVVKLDERYSVQRIHS